jgi:DNA-binding NarL/FixJ family response regulator
MIRVLLADDHGLVREGLRGILAKGADIEVAAEAANGDEVLALVRKQDFDLVLLDLSMPGLSGLALIKRIKAEKPKLRILVLSMHGEAQYAARALKAGASGYLTKDSAASQLLGAIRKIAAGGVQISEAAAALLIGASTAGDVPLHDALSDREYEVLRRIVAGGTVTDIAQALSVSVKTISTHKARILQKLNLAGTADLVRYAIEHGLTDERA